MSLLSCSSHFPRVQLPLIVLLYQVIQFSIHLGYTDFAQDTDTIFLICLIVAFLAFFDLHLHHPLAVKIRSPRIFRTTGGNADYMPILLFHNILIIFDKYDMTIISIHIIDVICHLGNKNRVGF